VVLWGARADDSGIEWKTEHPFLAENWKTETTRFEFNLTTGKAKWDAYFPEHTSEFPVVNLD
jgi:hypothetical protein